jgi:hypothetical protein
MIDDQFFSTRYYIMWSSLSMTCDRSVVFFWYSGFPPYIWSLNQSGPHSCWFELIIILLQPYQDSDAIIKCNILAAWQEYEAYCLTCYMSFTEILFQFPIIIIVSEWLLFNTNLAISWQEQVNFQWNDDKVRCDNFYNLMIASESW